jgi:hypothetical protein
MQVLESFQISMQYLLKYNTNEYILEGVRKIIDIIIEDSEDDVTRFLPDKKAEYVKLMLSKIGELQTSEKKDNP